MTFKDLKTRRDFIRFGCRTFSAVGAAAAFGRAGLLSAAATPTAEDYKALVCIFLFGGNDANNVLIPNDANYKTYQNIRQNLAIPQAQLAAIAGLGTTFGLHPSLTPMAALYNKTNIGTNPNQLAILANVGTLVKPVPSMTQNGKTKPNLNVVPLPSNLFSHSDQQTQWQNATPLPNNQNHLDATSGWAGRLIDKVAANVSFPAGIGINSSALQLVGEITQPTTVGGNNFSVLGSGSPGADQRAKGLQQMIALSSGATMLQAAHGNNLKSAIDVAGTVDNLLNGGAPLTTAFPNTDIGQQLAQVATIIRVRSGLGAKRQIFFCSQGGYDTHSGQLSQQAQLLTDLAQAMSAFGLAMANDLGIPDKVVTFTESEFSRTFQPNGNAGTDHAWGSHALIMGASVKGGQIFGKFPTLALQGPDDSGDRGNWVPTTATDQYGATLANWFGGPSFADLAYVFPNVANFGTPPAFL